VLRWSLSFVWVAPSLLPSFPYTFRVGSRTTVCARRSRVGVTCAVVAALVTATNVAALGSVVLARADELVNASPGTTLGPYETASLRRALDRIGGVPDVQPLGKRIRHIRVVNEDVFGPEDGAFAVFNALHRTTREDIISREVLLQPGDLWDTDVALETRRRLANTSVTNLVVVVPLHTESDDLIDLLIVTRDIWSLRLNSNFEFQGDVLSRLLLQPSENNLFGWRKRLSAVFDLGLGRYALGGAYLDPNIRGTRWTLAASGGVRIDRATGQTEGSYSSLAIEHPLWSFKRKWGARFSVSHGVGVSRSFVGGALCTFDGDPQQCAADPASGVPVRYRSRQLASRAAVTRSFGQRVINRLSLSYALTDAQRRLFESDFVSRPDLRSGFVAAFLPRSETVSSFRLGYDVFFNRYRTFRDLATFDFGEDLRLGPRLTASVRQAVQALGSTFTFTAPSVALSWAGNPWRDAYVQFSAGASGRWQQGALLDQRAFASIWAATPSFRRALRLVARLGLDRIAKNESVRQLVLGGSSGLRGYPIGSFRGRALLGGNVELRTAGLPLWFTRAGAVAFWDFGGVDSALSGIDFRHNLGVGIRVVIPQFQRSALRVDVAFPTHNVFDSQGTQITQAGMPRLSAGFNQVF